MCSLLWVVARYWKMSSAIQSIWIYEIVQGFTIPWDRSGLGYSVNRKCFMMSWLVISCQCLGDSRRRSQETWSTNFVNHWTTKEKNIIEWRYILINIGPKSSFESQWSVSCTSMHNTCSHFLLIPFIRLCWRTIFLNYVLDVCVSLLLHLYYVNLIIDCEEHARYLQSWLFSLNT